MFQGPDYLHSDDGIVWIWHILINLQIFNYLWWCEGMVVWIFSVAFVQFYLPEDAKNVSWARLTLFQRCCSLCSSLWHFLINLHIYRSIFCLATAQSQCLILIGRGGGLIVLPRSCSFAYHQTQLKALRVTCCLPSADGVIWLYLFLGNFHIYYSEFYFAIAQMPCLMAIDRYDGCSTLQVASFVVAGLLASWGF